MKNFSFTHRINGYSTHQPVLAEAVKKSQGPVVEFGCGFGSTPLLHILCASVGRQLLTLESDREWIEKFQSKYQSSSHQFQFVKDWKHYLENEISCNTIWGVVFIDQNPWDARFETVMRLRNCAEFIVLHDCDYFPVNGMFGKVVEPITNSGSVGKRTYDDVFHYYREHFPLKPWPHFNPSGPPTLIASNICDCSWEINFRKYPSRITAQLIIDIIRSKLFKFGKYK